MSRRKNRAAGCLHVVAAVALPVIIAVAAAPAQPAECEPEVAAGPVTADRYPERRVSFLGGVIGLPDLT